MNAHSASSCRARGQWGCTSSIFEHLCMLPGVWGTHDPRYRLTDLSKRAERCEGISVSRGRRDPMAHGGYQCGAGRPAQRGRIEDAKFIDATRWHRIGLLEAGEEGRVYANWHGEPPLAYSALRDAVVLAFAIDGRAIEQRIAVARTPCQFGGARVWFACPRCDGRAARLYLGGDGFRCRSCARLSYASQRDSVNVRALRRIGFFPIEPAAQPTW